jgi:hypothetical protein
MRSFFAAALGLIVVLGPRLAAPSSPAAAPSQGERGFLDIASDPPAKIVVDGADTGKTTPQHHLELPVGHHKLKLITLDGAHQRSVGFTIDRGQTTQLVFHLAS